MSAPIQTQPRDHELKVNRAFQHLRDLDREITTWLNGDHHSVRPEGDPKTGTRWLATAEKPPRDPIGVLIGDFLHNLRSALDLLAFELANAHTRPLPDTFADASEFPIFGDEDRAGNGGIGHGRFHQRQRKTGDPAQGSGLHKIMGWHPDAQTVVEGLQPYYRGQDFRLDELWVLHDLDRTNKHRLLHTTIASFSGITLDTRKCVNVHAIGAGQIESLGGVVETDTPIGAFPPIIPIDARLEMHVEIQPALDIAFSEGTPCVELKPVLETLYAIYTYVAGTVIPALTPYL